MIDNRLDRPWAAVDPALSDVLRQGIDRIIEDVIRAVTLEVPEYARSQDQRVAEILREGVAVALNRLLDLLGSDEDALGPAGSVYERIGAGEFRSHRPLQAVLTAYRVGALATWRGLSELSIAAGVDALQTVRLAEACFAYINEISAASAAGYAGAQSAAAGQREALRAELVGAITDPAGSGQVAALAAELGWALPAEVTIAVWDEPTTPEEFLSGRRQDLTIGVLADVGSPVRARVLQRLNATVGPTGGLEEAALGFAQAARLHELRRAGRVAGPAGAASVRDHLPELLVAADEQVATALVERELGSLRDLDPSRRAVLVDTAASWLLNGGSRAAVAKDLMVHPQTVTYRMEAVRREFGARLATADDRWALLLALRCEQQGRGL